MQNRAQNDKPENMYREFDQTDAASTQNVRPPGPLEPWVDSFFFYSGPAPQVILPTGGVDLVFLQAPHRVLPPLFFHGFLDRPFFAGPEFGSVNAIGVRFKAGAAGALFGIPAERLSGSLIQEGAPTLLRSVQGSMLESTDCFEQLDMVIQALNHLASDRAAEPRLNLPDDLELPESLTVGGMAHLLGFSPRHFERLMKREVGMPPNVFLRMRRLRWALELRQRDGCPWVTAAYECGFAHQSHLVNECGRFTGFSPVELERLARKGMLYRTEAWALDENLRPRGL